MSDWTYRSLRRRDSKRPLSVDDSVDDIKDSMRGKNLASTREHIVVVSSPAEADIVVEVEGRRLTGSWTEPTSSERIVRVVIARFAATCEGCQNVAWRGDNQRFASNCDSSSVCISPDRRRRAVPEGHAAVVHGLTASRDRLTAGRE